MLSLLRCHPSLALLRLTSELPCRTHRLSCTVQVEKRRARAEIRGAVLRKGKTQPGTRVLSEQGEGECGEHKFGLLVDLITGNFSKVTVDTLQQAASAGPLLYRDPCCSPLGETPSCCSPPHDGRMSPNHVQMGFD